MKLQVRMQVSRIVQVKNNTMWQVLPYTHHIRDGT